MDNVCRAYEEQDESYLHNLCNCEALQNVRENHFSRAEEYTEVELLEEDGNQLTAIKAILDFIGHTGMFGECGN